MKFWMTRDKRFNSYDLHCSDPAGKITAGGTWIEGIATFDLDEGSDEDSTAFQSEFPLEPGGGPLKVELRVPDGVSGNSPEDARIAAQKILDGLGS